MNLHTGKLKFEEFHKSNDNLYWLKDGIVGVTNQKAIGILYIDDRSYRYDSTKNTQCIKEIKELLR